MIGYNPLTSINSGRSASAKEGTILVIDDDVAMRAILTSVLSQEFSVVTKKNGLEAMIWLSEGNMPDVILSDIMMPHLNGYDFIKNLRKSGIFSQIPVLVLSGHDAEDTEEESLKLGANGYFSKPFDPRVVLDFVLKMYLQASSKRMSLLLQK